MVLKSLVWGKTLASFWTRHGLPPLRRPWVQESAGRRPHHREACCPEMLFEESISRNKWARTAHRVSGSRTVPGGEQLSLHCTRWNRHMASPRTCMNWAKRHRGMAASCSCVWHTHRKDWGLPLKYCFWVLNQCVEQNAHSPPAPPLQTLARAGPISHRCPSLFHHLPGPPPSVCLMSQMGLLLSAWTPIPSSYSGHRINSSRYRSLLSARPWACRESKIAWVPRPPGQTLSLQKMQWEGVDSLPLPENILPSPTSEVSWVKTLFHMELQYVTVKKRFPRFSQVSKVKAECKPEPYCSPPDISKIVTNKSCYLCVPYWWHY